MDWMDCVMPGATVTVVEASRDAEARTHAIIMCMTCSSMLLIFTSLFHWDQGHDLVNPYQFMCEEAVEELRDLIGPIVAQFATKIPPMGKFKALGFIYDLWVSNFMVYRIYLTCL